MDVLEGPTLVDALATRKHLTEDDVKVVLAKLLDAVNYMHLNSGKQNYINRFLGYITQRFFLPDSHSSRPQIGQFDAGLERRERPLICYDH